jgi:hypothetical protein
LKRLVVVAKQNEGQLGPAAGGFKSGLPMLIGKTQRGHRRFRRFPGRLFLASPPLSAFRRISAAMKTRGVRLARKRSGQADAAAP